MGLLSAIRRPPIEIDSAFQRRGSWATLTAPCFTIMASIGRAIGAGVPAGAAGAKGAVPIGATGAQVKFLRGDATWADPSTGATFKVTASGGFSSLSPGFGEIIQDTGRCGVGI